MLNLKTFQKVRPKHSTDEYINNLKLKIERSQNGGTVSVEDDPEIEPTAMQLPKIPKSNAFLSNTLVAISALNN